MFDAWRSLIVFADRWFLLFMVVVSAVGCIYVGAQQLEKRANAKKPR